MSKLNTKLNNPEYTHTGLVALKTGALLTVISFIAVVGSHAPFAGRADVIAAPASTVTSTSAEPYVYFPSQYDEEHAPDSSDTPATF